MAAPEEDFKQHVDEAMGCIDNALDELTGVRVYTLSTREVLAVKIAQYALRDASTAFDNKNLAENSDVLEDYFG